MTGLKTFTGMLGMSSLTEFFTKEIFKIGNFPVLLWHLCAVAVLLLIIVVIAIRVAESKREKQAKEEQMQSAILRSTDEQPTEEINDETPEEQPVETQPQPIEETTPEIQQEEELTAEENIAAEAEQPLETHEEAAEEEVVAEQAPADDMEDFGEEVTEEEPEAEQENQPEQSAAAAAPAEEKPARRKNYHVSLREDGKWQVKLSRGERALKLFETQAEAIKFAKDKAKAQKGYITIHMTDGKIRRQKY